jgi:hypothetical protein
LPPVICAIISARSLRGRRLRLISVTCERPIQGAANSGRKVTIASGGRLGLDAERIGCAMRNATSAARHEPEEAGI